VGFSPSADADPTLAGVFDTRLRQMRESGELAAILARYGLDDWAKGTSP
jgi:ABC-type amino acid transport substrate-binding protein